MDATATNVSDAGAGPTETAAGGAQIEALHASDIRIGDESQDVNVRLSGTEPAEERDLYVDLTSLTETNIDTQGLGIVAETSSVSPGWLVADAAIIDSAGIVVRVTVARQDVDGAADFATVNIAVTGLRTEAVEQMVGLEHAVTLSMSAGGPDFTTGKTDTYDVIDPDEIENVLRVRPSDIRIGETAQQVGIVVERATDEIALRLALAPLREVDVDIGGGGVVVEETSGERRNDEGEVDIEITETAVVDGVVQVGITTTADTLAVDILITGLDTDEAEATSGITYPVYTGERPAERAESRSFSISGATV
ncbi:hypothetical protein EGH22_13770 [Halomicroarcula sp. F28]|nr:hypothetical protein [Halomicroarcula salinisoli]MBX0287400.1 hypothetical protein [Halomicroarcula salinisoli]